MGHLWNDQQGSRDRRAWCVLVSGGQVRRFAGESIPGVVAVVGADYSKDGKWSSNTYRLELAPGVRLVAGHLGWEQGSFAEGLASATSQRCDLWLEVANALGVGVEEARRFLVEEMKRPKEAASLDERDRALAALSEEAADEGESRTYTFGSPTRRAREAGFWTWPIIATVNGREVGRVTPGPDEDWSHPTQSESMTVLAVTRKSGHGGGNVELRLHVPAGAVLKHGEDKY